MKDLLIGIAVCVITGYIIRKLEDDGHFRSIHECLHSTAELAKKEARTIANAGLNKLENCCDSVHAMAEHGKEKIQ